MTNPSPNPTEQRSDPRKRIRLPIQVTIIEEKKNTPLESPRLLATTLDLSPNSLSFKSSEIIPTGSLLEIDLVLPLMSKTVKIKGSINRIKKLEEAESYSYGMGISEITEVDALNLKQFLKLIDIERFLEVALSRNATDIHLLVNRPPIFRIQGEMVTSELQVLSSSVLEQMLFSMLTDKQLSILRETREADFSYSSLKNLPIRINVHFERGNVAAAIRIMPSTIASLEELGLPSSLEGLVKKRKGLIIVAGPAGSGKTTTLASMIDIINRERKCKIITIEDPIEYVHQSKKSLIVQREVGSDTLSFDQALKYALRQDPDVVVIGETRDTESLTMAMTAAETGHLVFTTIHSPGAIECINRIIDVYPAGKQNMVRYQLAENLVAIIGQILLARKDNRGRVLATEVLIPTLSVRNIIRRGALTELRGQVESGSAYGMHSLEQSFVTLVRQGLVDEEIIQDYVKHPDSLL